MQSIHPVKDRIPCTVNVSKTIQEVKFEPFVIELQETKWVTEKEYDDAHIKIYNRLSNRIDQIIKERYDDV